MPAVQTVAQARYASGEAEERPGDEWSHVLRAILDVERYPGLLSASTLVRSVGSTSLHVQREEGRSSVSMQA